MAKTLVLAEKPSVARELARVLGCKQSGEGYLEGEKYIVTWALGHLVELAPPEDYDKAWAKWDMLTLPMLPERMKTVVIPQSGRQFRAVQAQLRRGDVGELVIATDAGREGELVARWILEKAGWKGPARRLWISSQTDKAIREGFAHLRPAAEYDNLFRSARARSEADWLVGLNVTRALTCKHNAQLSAGRVQSVATRLVCEREADIKAFVPQEYWSLDADLSRIAPNLGQFKASFYGREKKVELNSEAEVNAVMEAVKNAPFAVTGVKRQDKQRNPAPPFITSTLQQEASRKLNMTPRRTMSIAQQLYEGVDIEGEGTVGLITYMRTDSLRLSDEATAAAKEFILSRYGADYYPGKARVYKTKSGAQDAHEAIRPSNVNLTPEDIKKSLTAEQYKLYKLIWSRFLACQMAQCLQSTTQADITGNGYVFKASGYTVTFDGFTVLYVEGRDEAQEDEGALPPLEKDMTVRAKEIVPNQHFTQPPPRYTEASLIKAMEEYGIGRPSTYAATITTITGREYVVRDGKALKPTELGEVTTKLMKERFPKIVNVKFTAQMEEDLDGIEAGKENWVDTLEEFYGDFDKTLQKAKEEMKDVKITLEEDKTDLICEKCGRQMVVKVGRYGKFIACPGYPECKNIKKFVKETGAECPKCGGRVIEKKTKKGRVFYGCDHYPECDFVSWDEPIQEKCPKCGKTLLKKKGKKPKIYCVTEGCGYERVEDQDEN